MLFETGGIGEEEMMDFSILTACGECCDGCPKKVEGIAKDVLKQMDTCLNGLVLADAKYMPVPEYMEFNFVAYARSFHVMSCL